MQTESGARGGEVGAEGESEAEGEGSGAVRGESETDEEEGQTVVGVQRQSNPKAESHGEDPDFVGADRRNG